ncbi:MAG TPA: acetyl-CoA hydrolase/transferase C-terminal domain-containing protein [Bacteroidia bacterium]|nr:acetyl-CoA hydrolase/transferase C-terminal domain-containing protein [Bacteroidia bacterium]
MVDRFTYSKAEDALSVIKSGQRVFIHGSAATPTFMLRKLVDRAPQLSNVELVCISVLGDFPVADPAFAKSFYTNSLFVSEPIRKAVHEGRADYVPVFLSEIPDLFRNNILPLDVAIVQVSIPDDHGYCSLGVSVDIARTAVNRAKHVIAQVNPQMPRTHGDGMIHVDAFHALVYADEPIHEMTFGQRVSDEEKKIGAYIAELIPDKATLQMGIGAIPDAVLSFLGNHKNLGIHTEMFSDGVIDLIESDVINNKFKTKHPGRTVTGFCLGSRRLYDYVHDNPSFAFHDIDYVNEVSVIRQNPKVHAINSCIEIDLTGQICSDSIGTYQYSGVGGQMDFMRGAALSEGGKPIIALASRTHKGTSRIVPFLKQGAGVVTTRAHVHYVVTEYGVAFLLGKNLRQRAQALIDIAHPDDREMLDKAAFERFATNFH